MNKIFTIYQANHAKCVEYVGFSIKGIRFLFEKIKLPLAKEGPVVLAELIDQIIKSDPEAFGDLIQKNFANVLNLEVEDLEYAQAA